jgi:GT2 family glycosyltransferase
VDCVFVVIGYNNLRLTEACLASFRRVAPEAAVWLYDNASVPELQPVADKYQAPYFRSSTNLGFAGGANRAIGWVLAEANPGVVCVVNNDVVVSEHFAQPLDPQLRLFLQDPRLAAMTPLLYKDRELSTPENFGVVYYRSGLAFQNRTGVLDDHALLNGAFLFLKSDVCRQLIAQDGAVFRTDYFFNAEDVELSLRLLSRGYTIRVNSTMRVQHLGSQSAQHISAVSFRLAWRNLLWTLLITRSNRELLADMPFIVAGQFVQLMLALLRGRPDLLGPVVTETWRQRGQLRAARRRFQVLKRRDVRAFLKRGVFPAALFAAARYRA